MLDLIEREIASDHYHPGGKHDRQHMPGLGAGAAELASKLPVKTDAFGLRWSAE